MRDIQETRVKLLNDRPPAGGDYVLYWMQQSQRAEYNHALEYALRKANTLDRPLLVVFGLTAAYPEANLRHYTFMLEGLRETQAALAKRGIRMAVRPGHPPEVALRAGRKASLIVCDRGYLSHQIAWRTQVAEEAPCGLHQVESDLIVPLEVSSDKAEFAARTLRPRIGRHLDTYLTPLRTTRVARKSTDLDAQGLDLRDIQGVLAGMALDRAIGPVSALFKGGTSRARARFARFLRSGIERYEANSNQPQTDDVSHMSMYLHFGQISPLYLALKVRAVDEGLRDGKAAYLEELIVRRELAFNFVARNPSYATFDGLPQWARKTLRQHAKDRREPLYTRERLERAETHDPYWNACMKEMVHTGFMHNYMRMYWGKKVLEWSRTPEAAFETLIAMNNRFFLDGRDPNSFAGVAWIFGLHDRAWKERPIFGKVRYMAASGLERKCDIRAYVAKVEKRIKELKAQS